MHDRRRQDSQQERLRPRRNARHAAGSDPTPFECDSNVEVPVSPHRDTEPERESFKVADRTLQYLAAEEPSVFVVNFSASAVAAETGNLEHTIEAVQYVDTCLGGVIEKVRAAGGVSIVTSSHAGCERMIDSAGLPNRFASDNPVPLHIVDDTQAVRLRDDGSLCDVAPTILGILGLESPEEMTGRDLRM